MEKVDELRELKKLLDEGVITRQDYDRKKEMLLFGTSSEKSLGSSYYLNEKVKQNKARQIVKSKDFIFNIITSCLLVALIFFLSFSRVGNWGELSSGGTYRWYTSPFAVDDCRVIFSIFALSFSCLSLILYVLSFVFKNKGVSVLRHIVLILTVAWLLISFIFNITYRVKFLHICSLLGIIFSGIVLILEVVVLSIKIKEALKK